LGFWAEKNREGTMTEKGKKGETENLDLRNWGKKNRSIAMGGENGDQGSCLEKIHKGSATNSNTV